MSWFDPSGFANIAKSALREAQKTIDKALDIREDGTNLSSNNTPIDTNPDDFFSTWGFAQSEDNKHKHEASTLWGSFAGSFFDGNKDNLKSSMVDSLDDPADGGDEHFAGSQLVVQHSDEVDTQYSRLSSMELEEGTLVEVNDSKDLSGEDIYVVDKEEKPSSSKTNRLSIISNESEKNSSESVELATCSTDCTTSPESEHTISTSVKHTSESVEILADITSPSFTEISICDNSSSGSGKPDEFTSFLESPVLDEEGSTSAEINSPDSVEVILEDQEESVAEDTMSYTSISESTSATVLDQSFVHLKPQKMLKDTYNAIMPENVLSGSEATSFNFLDAIVKAPSRGGMYLPLPQLNQVLIDTQPQSSRQDLTSILKNTNLIDIPHEEVLETQTESCDEGSQSDRTIIAKDGGMDSSSDASITEGGMGSAYLKSLIADAMTEKLMDQTAAIAESVDLSDLSQSVDVSNQPNKALVNVPATQLNNPLRENSPVSSESKSDLVKIGSDHTSGHTSGDELETTTSSDIEIISSPNGDSSSTQSRQSPIKQTCHKLKSDNTKEVLCRNTMKRSKGHRRELSEASCTSDDFHSLEIDRLIKRVSEITEILESRESKLIEINRRNADLEEKNADLTLQLDAMFTKQLESVDLSQVTEEYTERLSTLEKKFQQAIRDKDALRKQLDHTKQEASARMSKTELESLMNEKDEIINELREEGEKLSKQQLQHSNIIKKLRAKEKENESVIRNQKESIENLFSESDRLKRSLAAKEEIERSQIEAIHQLTTQNKKNNTEIAKLRDQLDDLTQKHDTLKKSLDAAKKDLIEKNKTSSELIASEHKLESLENQKRLAEDQNSAMLNELEELRNKMRQLDMDYQKKELNLRRENNELLQRLEDAEARNEELSQSVLEVSKPILRQLESLQNTHTIKVANLEKIEQELSIKLHNIQTKLQVSLNSERLCKEEIMSLKSKISTMESEVSLLQHQNELKDVQIETQKAEKQIVEQELKREIADLKEELKVEKRKIDDYFRNANSLQEQFVLEKLDCDSKPKRSSLQETGSLTQSTLHSRSNSPTLSLGKVSAADSLGSSFWPTDEPFDIGQSHRYINMFEMQMLQNNLKQRDGEVQQLQWELNRREQERSLLNLEISSLLNKIEHLENKSKESDVLKLQQIELQQQYDTLCQLFGEKVEENEELKLDLQDVKDMYKSQIDDLLRQQQQQQQQNF